MAQEFEKEMDSRGQVDKCARSGHEIRNRHVSKHRHDDNMTSFIIISMSLHAVSIEPPEYCVN